MYHYGYYEPFSIFHVLGWFFVIFIIIMLIKNMRGRNSRYFHNFMGDNAMNIIREKYAKGEITKEEFEAKKKDLSL
jgi:uncharacterized membrane protein